MEENCFQHLPVTALLYINSELLLSGEGSYLNVYDILTLRKKCFLCSNSKSVIHWIKKLPLLYKDNESSDDILICYGGDFIGLAIWNKNGLEDQCNYFPCYDLIKETVLISSSHEQHSCITISAHNIVEEYKLIKYHGKWALNRLRSWRSLDSSILYSAFLYYCPEEFTFSEVNFNESLLVASGTAFGELLLWRITDLNEVVLVPRSTQTIEVSHRLKEHKGAIFAIDIHWKQNCLCTVSDDRTVAVWRWDGGDFTSWRFSLLMRLFGHEARIWACRITDWGVVTIGENCQVLAWNWQKEICFQAKSHHGRNIWCMDLIGDRRLVTGGNDGAICLQDLSIKNSYSEKILSITEQFNLTLSSKDFPRSLYFNGQGILYVVCDSGYILAYDISDDSWQLAYDGSVKFSSYCAVNWNQLGNRLICGGIRGELDILNCNELDNGLVCVQSCQFDGKIMTCLWLKNSSTIESESILLSLNEGLIILLKSVLCAGDATSTQMKEDRRFILPPARAYRWMTAAVQVGELLVVGDREGRLHIYGLNSGQAPVFSMRCHDKSGVTCLIYDDIREQLISSGKTGVVSRWKIINDSTADYSLLNMGMIKNPGGATSVFQLKLHHEDILVEGFHSTEFRIVSLSSEACHFKCTCGGANRSWDYWSTNDAPVNEMFAFISKGRVYIRTKTLSNNTKNLKNSLHGAEINSCLTVPYKVESNTTNILLITGGEDCSLCWGRICIDDMERPAVFQRQRPHISSIRDLCIATQRGHQPPCLVVIAVGGRSMLSIWRVEESLLLLTTKQLKLPIKTVKKQFTDLRIMAVQGIWLMKSAPTLLVIMACSDGYLYFQEFHYESQKLKDISPPIPIIPNSCLLDVVILESSVTQTTDSFSLHVMTTSTGGILHLCHLSCTFPDGEELEEFMVKVVHELNISQCAANCVDIEKNLVLVGGDDGAVYLAVLDSSVEEGTAIHSVMRSPPKHTAGISRVTWCDCSRFLSMGADQRIVLWRYDDGPDPVGCYLLGVSDPHDLSIVEKKEESILVLVVGNGAEMLRIKVK